MRGAQELLGQLQLPGHRSPVLVARQHRPQAAQSGTAAKPVEQHGEVALQRAVQRGHRRVVHQAHNPGGGEREHDHGQQRERGRTMPGHRVEGQPLHARRPDHRRERRGGEHEARDAGVSERSHRELDGHPRQRRAGQQQREPLRLLVGVGDGCGEADPEREHQQPEAGAQGREDRRGRRVQLARLVAELGELAAVKRIAGADPLGNEPGHGHARQDQRKPQPAARPSAGPPASVRE
jgi:hypothetical protein